MKVLVFDTGPIISLTMNNLLWLLKPMQDRFGGQFYITERVKRELVDRPFRTKRFKFEALQTLHYVDSGILKLVKKDRELKRFTLRLLELANHVFKTKREWLKIVHCAEIEALACAILYNADAMVVDERTTRLILEDPETMRRIFERKLHTKISIDRKNLNEFMKLAGRVRLIRSVELVTVAYELGLLDRYAAEIVEPKKNLLDAVLWGVKLDGCAVTKKEIDQIIRLETGSKQR